MYRTLSLFLILLSLISCGTTTKVSDCSSTSEPVQNVVRNETCTALHDESQVSGLLWGNRNKFWPKGSTLRVRFLNGTAAQKSESWKRIQHVDNLIGLSFVQVDQNPSDIRILFNPSGGHWSYVGTDNRNISQNTHTMNLGFGTQTPSYEYDRVVIHELLHALGFLHEQQHPLADIPWDEPKVIDYYARTQGWSESHTRTQVLNNSKMTNNFEGSKYDPSSIMHYPVNPSLTKNGYSVGWNTKLSECDIIILQKVYGKN